MSFDTILVQIVAFDPVASAPVTIRASSSWAIGDAAVVLNGQTWTPALSQAPSYTVDLGTVQGSTSADDTDSLPQPTMTYSAFELYIASELGNLAWQGYDFDGATFDLWTGTYGSTFANYTHRLNCLCGAHQMTDPITASIQLRGNDTLLLGNMLTRSYAGTGGAEGDTNLKGNLKPWLSGPVFNLTPVTVDSVNQVYQVHGYGAISDINAVYENALSLGNPVTNSCASYSDLINLTLVPGQWAKAPAVGMFRLGAIPSGVITADATGALDGAATPGTVGAICSHVMRAQGGIAAASISSTSVTALDQSFNHNWSTYVTDQVTVGDFVREALAEVHGYILPNTSGQWIFGRDIDGGATTVLNGDRSTIPQVTDYQQVANPSSRVCDVRVGQSRNWTVLDASQVSDVVKQAIAQATSAAQTAATAQTTATTANNTSNANATAIANLQSNPSFDTTAPAVPSGLTAGSGLNPQNNLANLTLSWTAVTSSNLDHYDVQVATNGGSYVSVGSPTTNSFVVYGLQPNTPIQAQVRSVSKAGILSAFSTAVSYTVTKDSVAPSAPTAFTIYSVGLGGLTLKWTNDTAADLATVAIYENTTNNSATAVQIATVNALPGQAGGYSRSGLPSGSVRYYWLKSLDTSSNPSAFSAVASGTVSSVAATDFTPGLQPTSSVASLPSASGYTGPSVVFNQTDGQIYRYTGGAFVASVPAVNVTGTLTGSQLAAGIIDATKLTSGLVAPQVVSKTNMNDGTVVAPVGGALAYNITDQKLYSNRDGAHLSTAWYPTVADATQISGQLTASQIASVNASTMAGVLATANIPGIDASKIISGQFGTSQFATGSVTGAIIAGATILGTNIAGGTITGNLIAGQTITGTNIKGGTITGDLVAANTISGTNIIGATITGTNIAGQTITGSNIVAGTLTASLLQAGSITASKLAIVGETLFGDAAVADVVWWTGPNYLAAGNGAFNGGWYIESVGTGDAAGNQTRIGSPYGWLLYDGSYRGNLNGKTGGEQVVPPIMGGVTGGQYYEFGSTLYNANANYTSNRTLNMNLQWFDATGTYITGQGIGAAAPGAGKVNVHAQIQSPANAAAYRVYWEADGDASAFGGILSFGSVFVRQAGSGSFIIDGSITAAKIQAYSITGDRIVGATITGTNIAGSTITGSNIAGNTITGGNIVAGTITGNLIAAQAITATKLGIAGASLFPDGQMQDAAWWTSTGVIGAGYQNPAGSYYIDNNGTTGVVTAKGSLNAWVTAGSMAGSTAANIQIVPPAVAGVIPGEFYEFKATLYNSSNRPNLSMNVQWYNNNTFISSAGLACPNDSTSRAMSFQSQAPSGATHYRLYWDGNGATTAFTGQLYIGGITVRQANSGTMVIDGTLTASKIQVGSLTGDRLAGNTITGDKISSSTSLPATLTIGSTGFNLSTVAAGAMLPIGKNLVPYSDFEATTNYWGVYYNTGGIPTQLSNGVYLGRKYMNVGFTPTASGQTIDLTCNPSLSSDLNNSFPVQGGATYAISAFFAGSNTSSQIFRCWWFDSNGVNSGNALSSSDVNVAGTGNNTQVGIFAVAPAGAVRARVEWYATSSGTSQATLTCCNPMVCQVAPGTTVQPAYNPGPIPNAANVINANTTTINPGKVLISGGTTLNSWIYGGDNTSINGGVIGTNTIKTNSIVIGARGVSTINIRFSNDGGNIISWTDGYVEWWDEAFNRQVTHINAGSASRTSQGGNVSGVCFVWFDRSYSVANGVLAGGESSAASIMSNPNNVILANYFGGNSMSVNYGQTTIDGSEIRTGSINASATITAGTIVTGNLQDNSVTQWILASNPGPFQGGSSSGSGGGGTVTYCVADISHMPSGKLAGDMAIGDDLHVLNRDDDMGYHIEQVVDLARSVQPCSRIETTSGITLVVSNSTPITLRGGKVVSLMAAHGREVPVADDDGFRWEKIVAIEPVGELPVTLIFVDHGTYAAGEKVGRYIFTHNKVAQ